jgi:hypothetical protein
MVTNLRREDGDPTWEALNTLCIVPKLQRSSLSCALDEPGQQQTGELSAAVYPAAGVSPVAGCVCLQERTHTTGEARRRRD